MHTSVDGAGSFPSRPLAGRAASEASRVGGLWLARSKNRPPTPPAFASLMRSTLPANGREGTAIERCASLSSLGMGTHQLFDRVCARLGDLRVLRGKHA